MKKNQTPAASTVAMAVAGLETSIHSHAEFFDQLVQLIPARFYSQNDDVDKPWIQGLSKAARASLKKQTKNNLKLARRQRFDPDHKPDAPASEEGDEGVEPIDGDEEENKERLESVTYEELRQRLRRKIESLRGNRGEGRPEKRRRDWDNDGEERNENGDSKEEAKEDEEEEIIEYGKVRLGDDEGKKKKRKLSKSKELEMAQKLQEEKKEKPYVAEKESWNDATSRAMGVKVHNDAKLIKESIKKEKKRKEKSSEKWKERVDTQVRMKEDRQKKRRDNIVGRINENKARKIAKREKKLARPGRPGFEGRLKGFITKD